MSLSLDRAFGVHADALLFRSRRAEVLSSNLANSDTPGYKARDIDFASMLDAARGGSVSLKTTHERHLGGGDSSGMPQTLYRVPQQAALDGNTVEVHIEQAKFMENAMQFQASFDFLNGRISTLKTAIRGE